MESGALFDAISITWLVVLFTFSILACIYNSSWDSLPHYFGGERLSKERATRIAKQALRAQPSGMGQATIGSDVSFTQKGKTDYPSPYYEGSEMNHSADSVLQLMHDKFPGMEHYFVSDEYEVPVTPQGRRRKYDPHRASIGFVYCGFVDSLFEPIQACCWRSVTLNGLYRHVIGEDPDYHQDESAIPETRRRFNL